MSVKPPGWQATHSHPLPPAYSWFKAQVVGGEVMNQASQDIVLALLSHGCRLQCELT